MITRHKLSFTQLLAATALAWTIQVFLKRWWVAKRLSRAITRQCPPSGGALTLFHPFRTLSIALASFYPFKGQMGWYSGKFSLYKKYGSTCLASVTFWDAIPTYWFADADAIKVASIDRVTFMKDLEAYDTLFIYGPSLIGTEGTEWKRHKAIAKSAFNEANNAFVWQETTRIVNEWFASIDSRPGAQIDLLEDLTRVTLLVIASAGFGRRSTWIEDVSNTPPPGHSVPFSPAVRAAIDKLYHRILTPRPLWNWVAEGEQRGKWVPGLGPMLLNAKQKFEDLRAHMMEVVSQARDWVAGGMKIGDQSARSGAVGEAALLRTLVQANMTYETGEGKADYRGLTDGELLSNMFLFFLAGHETSAHTLCFAFVYLALHPEYQQKLYEETVRIWPDGTPSVAPASAYKEILPKLEYTLAVFRETLRLRPPVVRLAKLVQNDTVMKSRCFDVSAEGKIKVTQEVNVPVPKGGMVVIDILGLHMNPIYWGEDVEAFRPDRFLDTDEYKWPRDAFLAFSAGPRSCIGERFAMTESLCVIASIMRRYEILLPEDVLRKPWNEQVASLTAWAAGFTIIPSNARVRFRKRSGSRNDA